MPQNIYHVCENNFDEFVYLTLIHYFVYSYNGILGDYAVNNHDITVQFMRRFLIGHQLAVADWPDIVTPDFLGTIYGNTEHRGTISTIGNDHVCHANVALASDITTSQLMISPGSIDLFSSSMTLNGRQQQYLHEADMKRLQGFYDCIFPSEPKPMLLRRVDVIKSVLYHGEHFQVENSDKVNCNIIRAKWLKVGFPLVIDPKEKFARSGTIQRILLTQHIMNGVKQHMVLFDVDWFSMHDEPYAYGHHVHMYHKNVCEPGPYSFIPIQRVLSKCALNMTDFSNISVNIVIPLPGQWAF